MVSVIIPAHNEEHSLPTTIRSIYRQLSRYQNGEAIVVLDGCTDNTLEVAGRMQASYSRLSLVIQTERQGKAMALCAGKDVAKGEILVLTDADVLWGDNALDYLLSHFHESAVGLACAQVSPLIRGNSLLASANRINCQVWHVIRSADSAANALTMPSGNLYAMRAFLFPDLPAVLVNDDAYIGLHVAEKGYRLVYDPRAVVSVCFPTNMRDYFRQKIRTYRGRMQLRACNSAAISTMHTKLIRESVKQVFTIAPRMVFPAVLNVVLIMVSRVFALFESWTASAETYSKWEPIDSTKLYRLPEQADK